MAGFSLSSGLTVSTGLSLADGLSTGGGLSDAGFIDVTNPAVLLLGDEPEGFAIDFVANEYARRTIAPVSILDN